MKTVDITELKMLEAEALVFSNLLKPGLVVILSGDLGAGKTTFVKYLLQALQYKMPVVSPSFAIAQEYKSEKYLVEHWDLYRLNQVPEELLEESSAIRLLEWGEKFPELLNYADYQLVFAISFFSETEQKRSLTFKRL